MESIAVEMCEWRLIKIGCENGLFSEMMVNAMMLLFDTNTMRMIGCSFCFTFARFAIPFHFISFYEPNYWTWAFGTALSFAFETSNGIANDAMQMRKRHRITAGPKWPFELYTLQLKYTQPKLSIFTQQDQNETRFKLTHTITFTFTFEHRIGTFKWFRKIISNSTTSSSKLGIFGRKSRVIIFLVIVCECVRVCV